MRIRGFIIHLERAVPRRRQAEACAASLPMPAEIMAAVDGRLMSDDERQAVVRRRLLAPRYPFELSQGETACFLSHRKAWQRIVDSGLDAGLIVEDDVAPASDAFSAAIESAVETAQPEEFIRFPMHDRGEQGAVVRTAGPIRFIEPRLPGLNMQMQLVGRDAARLLLAASERFDRPVDSFVQMQWIHGARVLTTRPVVIRELGGQLGGSVIQNKRMNLVEKFVHEFQRPLHRFSIRAVNEQWRRKSA